MKKIQENYFKEYIEKQSDEKVEMLKNFFQEFHTHCLLKNTEKNILRGDFEKAILYYETVGVPLEKALELLDIKYLGGFYARPPILWFALDDAAKIYPMSMKHGRMPIFRLSVYLEKDVVPEMLQMALNFTIKRFPSFATTLKKGFFWHYLDTAKRRFCVEQENDIPCQPIQVSYSGSQAFRVLYYNNRISVEFFHVLTDGTGGMTFLKTLTAEYLRLVETDIMMDETLWNANDIPDTEEFENAFAKVPQSDTASGFIDKTAVQMSGKLAVNTPCRIVHLKMNTLELKEASKKYNTTITGYLLMLMFLAGKAATDELSGEISIQVPVNMRKFYPSETVRNFSMYCGIRIPIAEIGDTLSMVNEINEQLHKKASKDAMNEMLTSTEKMVSMLKYVPLAVKQPVAKVIYGFLGDKIFTNTLSNLGVVEMPSSISRHIESMDFILGTAITNRAGCSVVTFNNVTTFSIAKMTVDPSFEEKMYDLLQADGVEVSVEGSGYYEN